MKIGIAKALAIVALATTAQTASANDCQSRQGGAMNHTMEIYTFGFFPNILFVCPGDSVRFQNKSFYPMTVEVDDILRDEDNDLTDYDTGDLYSGNTSPWFTVTGDVEATFRQELVGYNYGNSQPYLGEFVIGVAPTEYEVNERYEDPDSSEGS